MKNILYALLFFISVSCSEDSRDFIDKSTKPKFGPVYQDTFHQGEIKLQPHSIPKYINTFEFLKTMESLLNIYPQSEEVTQSFLDFYAKSDAVVRVEIKDAAYIHAALGLYGADVMNALTSSNFEQEKLLEDFFSQWYLSHNDFERVDLIKRFSEKAANAVKGDGLNDFIYSLQPKVTNFTTPVEGVDSLINGVKSLPKAMQDFGVASYVVEIVAKFIQDNERSISDARNIIADIDWDTLTAEGLLKKYEEVEGVIDDLGLEANFTKGSLASYLEMPRLLSKYKENPNPETIIEFLFLYFDMQFDSFNQRNNLSLQDWDRKKTKEQYKDQFIDEQNESVRAFFSFVLSELELKDWYLVKENQSFWKYFTSPVKRFKLGVLIQRIESDFDIHYTEKTLSYAVKDLLTEQVAYYHAKLPQILGDLFLSAFRKQTDELFSNFQENMFVIANQKVKEDFLGENNFIAGYELKYLQWPIVARSTQTINKYTGGKELSQGVISSLVWLENVDRYKKPQADSYGFIAFSLVNRLLAAYGYRNLSGSLYSPLHTAFTTTTTPLMDIYTYRMEKGVFAIPDNIRVISAYDVEHSKNQVQSVAAMAANLRSAAKLLNFFADYNVNSYDKRFSAYQFQDFNVFPKEPMFDLSLGAAIIVLENLTKNGLTFINSELEKIGMQGRDIAEVSEGAKGVVLYPRKKGGYLSQVSTEDLADFIIALKDFLAVAENLERTKFGILSVEIDGVRKDLETLKSILPLLRKFVYGLGLYFANHLVNTDGLVVATHDINAEKFTGSATSAMSQLKWMAASIEIYKMWKSDIFLWLAFDLYFAANKEFIDINTGLYTKGEKSFYYYEVTEHLNALQTINELICVSGKKFYVCSDMTKELSWWTMESDQQLKNRINAYKKLSKGMLNEAHK